MAMEHPPFDDFPLKPPFIYDFPAMEGTHPSLTKPSAASAGSAAAGAASPATIENWGMAWPTYHGD